MLLMQTPGRMLTALGCVILAIAVAAEAYAAHGLSAHAAPALVIRFERATHYLIVHGLALIGLAAQLRTPIQRIAIGVVILGLSLFAGGLSLSVFWPDTGWTRMAPVGGSLMIFGWLGLAAGFALQRR